MENIFLTLLMFKKHSPFFLLKYLLDFKIFILFLQKQLINLMGIVIKH